MEDYQQRVVDEKSELDGRLAKLVGFLADPDKHANLDDGELKRMHRQAEAMQVYSDVLGDRIADF